MPIQPDMAEHIPIPGDILFLKQNISNMPLQAGDIKSWTSTDPLLSTVCIYVIWCMICWLIYGKSVLILIDS